MPVESFAWLAQLMPGMKESRRLGGPRDPKQVRFQRPDVRSVESMTNFEALLRCGIAPVWRTSRQGACNSCEDISTRERRITRSRPCAGTGHSPDKSAARERASGATACSSCPLCCPASQAWLGPTPVRGPPQVTDSTVGGSAARASPMPTRRGGGGRRAIQASSSGRRTGPSRAGRSRIAYEVAPR